MKENIRNLLRKGNSGTDGQWGDFEKEKTLLLSANRGAASSLNRKMHHRLVHFFCRRQREG
jgi:hypothetical protein